MLLALLFISQQARAERDWFNGVMASVSAICPITNILVTSSQTYVGYYTDPAEPYPMTGDVAYVHAVATNISPCSNDAIGFDFYLPEGAELAIDAATPVYCFRGKLDGYYEQVPNADNSACSQSPSPGTSGGGWFFGYSALPPGWWLEIQVPVRFNKKLLGMAGPNTHKLYAVSHTSWGTSVAEQPVTVFYEADFADLEASGLGPTTARLDATLMSYFTSGTAYFDYGTSTNYGESVPVYGITDSSAGFTIYAQLSDLVSNVDYYWRVRYVTSEGVFSSPRQTFRTGNNPSVSYSLTVDRTGTGEGAVRSSPAGIACGADCAENYSQNSSVTLTAIATDGSEFSGWSGACSGTSATCEVTMNASKAVSAAFTKGQGAASSISRGDGHPVDSVASPGDSDVPLLQLELNPGAEALEVVQFELRANGTGDDVADVEAVKIYADANGNGEAEAGEAVIAEGRYSADDGTLTLTPAAPVLVTSASRFLVTYDFAPGAVATGIRGYGADLAATGGSVSLAAVLAGGLLVLLSALGILFGRRLRTGVLLVGLTVVLSACGGAGPASGLVGRTYTVTLEEVLVERESTAAAVSVGGVPITGATVTVR